MATIKFFVAGLPQSRGSKRAFPFKKKNGGLGVAVSDNNPKSKDWMATVAVEAADSMEGTPIFTGPVGVLMRFVMRRPKSHYKKNGELKDLAEKFHYHATRPDRGKLQRGVEDALTGIVYVDDAQVCCGPVEKVYGEQPGVWIEVTPMYEL